VRFNVKLPLIASLITCGLIATAICAVPPNSTRVPVLLELFTSEGCSSCPPADRLLESLDRQPTASADLFVLSEHVDYWNYLGWSDPYSSAFFSARQQTYSKRLGTPVYTPQLVIDGHLQATGSDRQQVTQAIARAVRDAKLPVSVRAARSGNGGTIHVEANSSGKKADLYIAIAADRARSQVIRGENGGHMLTHVAVTQSIIKIGRWEGAPLSARDISLPSLTHTEANEIRIIAMLQDPETGRILGVAQTRM